MSVSLLFGSLSYWNYTNIGISPVLVHLFQIILNFLYICHYVCLLTSLLKLDKRIYPVLDHISFWNFIDIPRIYLDYFQIILNFLYVCQSVSWLTFLLKLGQYRHISGPEWDICLKIFGDIPGRFLHYSQIIMNFLYVCQSVSWLTPLLKFGQYRHIVGTLSQFWC